MADGGQNGVEQEALQGRRAMRALWISSGEVRAEWSFPLVSN